jgi:hypothetical protein
MLEIVYDYERSGRLSIQALGYSDKHLKLDLTKGDVLRLIEALTSILDEPSDCNVARVWFDSSTSEGCIDFR